MDQSSSGAARAPAAISVEVIRLVSLAAVERAAAEWVATHPTVRIIRQTAPFAVGDHPDLINSGVWEIRIEYEEDGRRPAALFDRAALALFGEQYRAPLARALRLKRADTVDDWRTGRANVPKGVWNDMIALLAGRRSEMPDLLDDLRIQADLRKDSAFYEAAMIQDLMRECGDAEGKYVRLRLKYITRTFRTPKGQEFALHGYCRRMGLMVHCLENVYRSLPPDMTAVPLDEQVLDCTVNLQAFLINVFGALDNLAWVLVFEKNICKPDGSPLALQAVSLRRKEVFGALSPKLREELESYEKWFDYLENFRHPLAHRIPLYVPPYAIAPKDEAAHTKFEEGMARALGRGDADEHDRLKSEQMRLAFFRPVVNHSWSENAKGSMAFHPQLIADFKTVESLGWSVIRELDL